MYSEKDLEQFINEAIEEYNKQEVKLPANVLKFDPFKRRKPLMRRVNKEPCQVIDLATYRANKMIKYKQGA